jgi:putative addiction module killer protein
MDIRQTEAFRTWYMQLRDKRALAMIARRIDRLAYGLAGDAKPVGEGVGELRVDYGPGYRVYFKRHGNTLIVLLCGGDKRTQNDDIKLAKKLAKQWSERT